MEGYTNQERNEEKDKQMFLEEVKSVSIEEIPAGFEEEVSGKLMDSITQNQVFILGEMHGVKENADVIYTLFKKFGFRQLALEWESELHQIVDKYLETGEVDFEEIQESPDGRITAGHFALIKKLHDEGMLDKLICFDGSGASGWNQRDANMAKNILEGISDTPTLVVAGNLHAKTEPIKFEDEPEEHHPMGELVKMQIPNVPSGRIEYLAGHYHNYGTQEFFEDPELGNTDPTFYESDDGVYTFVLPEAHAATVPNPSERI